MLVSLSVHHPKLGEGVCGDFWLKTVCLQKKGEKIFWVCFFFLGGGGLEGIYLFIKKIIICIRETPTLSLYANSSTDTQKTDTPIYYNHSPKVEVQV